MASALGAPSPGPADPLRLALGSLTVALDRALVIAALRRLKAERARLVAERRRVAAAALGSSPGGKRGPPAGRGDGYRGTAARPAPDLQVNRMG